jgi:hypothetical protein
LHTNAQAGCGKTREAKIGHTSIEQSADTASDRISYRALRAFAAHGVHISIWWGVMTLAVVNLTVLLICLAAELVPALADAAASRELELAREQEEASSEPGEKRL